MISICFSFLLKIANKHYYLNSISSYLHKQYRNLGILLSSNHQNALDIKTTDTNSYF